MTLLHHVFVRAILNQLIVELQQVIDPRRLVLVLDYGLVIHNEPLVQSLLVVFGKSCTSIWLTEKAETQLSDLVLVEWLVGLGKALEEFLLLEIFALFHHGLLTVSLHLCEDSRPHIHFPHLLRQCLLQ